MVKVTKEKTTRIILHILIWAVILGLPIYAARRFQMGRHFLLTYYTITAISALIFYTNYLFLIPVLFFQKKRYRYYISVLALLFFFYFISDFASEQIFSIISKNGNSDQIIRQPGEERRLRLPPIQTRRPAFVIAMPDAQLIGYASSSLFMVFLSLGLRVLERQSKIGKMQEEMGKAKLNAELAFLKNQISPHFFFNTLNNIYSLISISAEDSQKAVLKLSKLMRYLLYDSEHDDTKLSNEIDFMNNYIDLMKLRMSNKINLSIAFPEKHEEVNIPPLIFIPFIENAFKHGISYREKSFIDISLEASQEFIRFRCANSLIKAREEIEPGHSGIGLENVTKRLNLLFPGKHDLKINKSDKEFEVLLQIKFA
jgi:sensor histidine kinase YesM